MKKSSRAEEWLFLVIHHPNGYRYKEERKWSTNIPIG
jgi:hypothetical protein